MAIVRTLARESTRTDTVYQTAVWSSQPASVCRHPAHERTIAAIDELATLRPGWDSYAAAPIEEAARRRAIAFVTTLLTHLDCEVPVPTVGPSPDGGVVLRWLTSDLDIMVTFLAQGGEYSVVHRDRKELIETGSIGRPESLVRDVISQYVVR